MAIRRDIWLSRAPMAGLVAVGFGWATFAAQVPVLKGGLGISDGLFGTVILVGSLGALMAMWLAPLCERALGAAALPAGALLMAGGFFWVASAPGLAGFTVALMLAAAGSGIADVLANARIAAIEAQSRRHLMNLNHAIYSFGYGGAALLTGAAREAGWSPMAIFAALALAVVAMAGIMRGGPPGAVDAPATQGAVRLSPALIFVGGAVVMVGFLAESATEGWSALHLERTLGGGAAQGALGPAILGLTMGVGRLMGHGLSVRLPDIPLMAGACLLGAAGLALAGAAPTLGWAYLGFALGGLGVSVVVPLALARVGRSVPDSLRLDAIARVSVLGYGAFFFGPPLMGFTAELLGLRLSFVLVAGLLGLTAALLLPGLARLSRAAPDPG